MNKNTIIAIVLSAAVLIGFFVIQTFVLRKNQSENPVVTENVEEIETVDATTGENSVSENEIFEQTETTENFIQDVEEKEITVETDKVIVRFTNKGGDIISYKLKNQKDNDTGDWIQLSDSVTDFNRTCAISFGNVEKSIINDNFEIVDFTEGDKNCTFRKIIDYQGKKYAFEKIYNFKDGEYLFKLDVNIHCLSEGGMNFDNVSYTIRTSPQIGPHYDSKLNRYEYRQYLSYDGNKYKKKNLGSGQFKRNDKNFIWEGIAGKYFVELIIPSNPEIINAGFYSTQVVDGYQNGQTLLERKSFNSNGVSDTYYMYFGPRSEKELRKYNVAENNAWNFSKSNTSEPVQYKLTQCLPTSGWLSWLEIALKWCLELLHKFIKNWGVCIIVLTILLKAAMFPISKKQSMSTLKMQQIQPKITEIQEKYKDDPKKVQAETSKIYQQIGYNPASGCLPMVFQFLVLFAMYNLFNNYFEFRGSEFIPYWIPDLSTGDSIVSWKKDIPLITSFTGNKLRLLPIIYLATQIFYGIITQYGGASQNSKSMKFMTYGMPAIFFFLFYSAPAGLLIYWIVSNVFQMGQQLIINKMVEKKKGEISKENKNPEKKLPPKAKSKMKKDNSPKKKSLFKKF